MLVIYGAYCLIMPFLLRLSLIKVRLEHLFGSKEQWLNYLVSNEIKTGHKPGKLVIV
jgi:hypothetical protein